MTDDSEDTEFKPITSQAELDKIIGERVKRTKARYADYDDLKRRVDELDSRDSELEAANTRLAAAELELAELAQESHLRAVAEAAGVPLACLVGTVAERMEAITTHLESVGMDFGGPRTPDPDPTQGQSAPIDTGPSDPMTAKLTKAINKGR